MSTSTGDYYEDSPFMARTRGILDKLFGSCAADPKGSVHRAWGISLVFVLVYFIISVLEMINLQSEVGASKALEIAAVWSGIVHVSLGILGTFILKRFPTSFSIGFLLGVLIIIANQNLIIFGTFHRYRYGNPSTNHAFGSLGFTLFFILIFFSVLLFHFKRSVIVSPIDTKGLGGNSNNNRRAADSYQQQEDDPSEA